MIKIEERFYNDVIVYTGIALQCMYSTCMINNLPLFSLASKTSNSITR